MIRSAFFTTLLALASQSASADVREAVEARILPGYDDFVAATRALAAADCSPGAMRAPWNAAFDAWLGVAHLRFGPVETDGRALAIAFWPDPKSIGARQIRAVVEAEDEALLLPGALAEVSVAARGLFALERLLYGDLATDAAYTCALRRALAADLAGMAHGTRAEWDGFAALLQSAGAVENTVYLSPDEARQALFTQLVAGLEFNADQRLGRPLGSFEHPRPERAEALASGRSMRNLQISLRALQGFARALAEGVGPIPQTEAAFARALEKVAELDDPVFASVVAPSGRFRVEIVQQAVGQVKAAALVELGPLLGVSAGFNAADGD